MLNGLTMLSDQELQDLVRRALAEDVGEADVTTLATIPQAAWSRAQVVAREPLVVSGLALLQATFHCRSPLVEVRLRVADGVRVQAGQTIASLQGPAHAILSGERVALNFLQRLSGVATITARFVAAVDGTRTRILDTRKTTPGLRAVEKWAVRCGGGQNHRFGLFDMVLIKDNHLAALRDALPNPIAAAVSRARETVPNLRVEVEADTLEEVGQAVAAGADRVLLDNMSLADLRSAVQRVAGRAETEASGGVSLDTVRAIAETGVDFISVGALTHSARAMDIGLDFEES